MVSFINTFAKEQLNLGKDNALIIKNNSYLLQNYNHATAPFFVAFLCYKKRRDPPYGKQVFELLGFYPYEFDSCIWFHGASVGEINSLKPLINKFSELYPQKTY